MAVHDEVVTAWTMDHDVREAAFSLQAARVPAVECATPRDHLDDPQLVRNIVADGCERARKLAEETMRDVREAMGLSYN